MPKPIIPYNPKLKELARDLRKNSTLSEVLLWNQIKNKALLGYDFHRQKPIGDYIVDFFCDQLSLCVEIDGYSHNEKATEDAIRQEYLEKLGLTVLRFSDEEVKTNLAGVVQAIENWIQDKGYNHECPKAGVCLVKQTNPPRR